MKRDRDACTQRIHKHLIENRLLKESDEKGSET